MWPAAIRGFHKLREIGPTQKTYIVRFIKKSGAETSKREYRRSLISMIG